MVFHRRPVSSHIANIAVWEIETIYLHILNIICTEKCNVYLLASVVRQYNYYIFWWILFACDFVYIFPKRTQFLCSTPAFTLMELCCNFDGPQKCCFVLSTLRHDFHPPTYKYLTILIVVACLHHVVLCHTTSLMFS